MATLDDAAGLALSLPSVQEGTRYGHRCWSVGGRVFAWERPFSKADVRRFAGAEPPDGPILAVTVGDVGEKEAVLAEGTPGVFTIPHFDGFPAVLLQLSAVPPGALHDAVVDAWLCCAPPDEAAAYLAARGPLDEAPGGAAPDR